MGIKKIICKKFEKQIYDQYKISEDILNIIIRYLDNLYLNKKEKEFYLIIKLNKLLKQKLNYFGFINNEYTNYHCNNLESPIYYVFINYLFERISCDIKITNKYNFRWNTNLGHYVANIEPNVYEVNIKTIFTFAELNTDNLKALRSILYRLRYLDKKSSVYYTSYSLKKGTYRQIYNLNIVFIVKVDDDNVNKQLTNIFKNDISLNRIYDFNNPNPLGENNKNVKKNIQFIKTYIIDKITNALDTNMEKLFVNKKMTNYN
jgi:hypothetical protein